MSADRFSVGEFYDFLDDSEGHRLAQFLQKKTGQVRPARPIFDCEPERFSLNVQVKRVSTPRNTQGRQEGEHYRQPTESPDKLKSSPLKLRVEESNPNAPLQEKEFEIDKTLISEDVPAVDESIVTEAPHVVQSPLVHSQPMVWLPERPLSPARRSGGFGTADRLRRYSLRRLSQLGVGGRRTLLKEFESTLSSPKFAPLVFSTPVCRPQLTSPVTSQAQETDSAGGNVAPAIGVTFTNADASKTSTSFGLSLLRRKDKELHELLEDVLDATIQKLHEKENSNNVHTEPTSPQHIREASCTPRSRHSFVHQIDANTEMPERFPGVASSKHPPNTEVLGTQELLQKAQRLLESLDSTRLQIPKIVIPVQQTFNGIPPTEATRRVLMHDAAAECRKEDDAADPAEQQPVQQKDGKQTPPSPTRNEKPVSPQLHYKKSQVNKTLSKTKSSTDIVPPLSTQTQRHDPSLAEIMTEDDDEDANETAPTIASCSQKSGPLNLVAARPVSVPSPHGPSRKLRGRAGSRRNRYLPECLKLTSTDTEAGPPPAHPFKIHDHQDANRKGATRKRPLNKAPNIPINGEKFADELKSHLARLTNYEILDLRKRNSIGDVFPISGRRHSVAAKQQAIERQLQLEEQIQMEILRRNLEGNVDVLESVQTEQQVQPQYEEMVPENFRDNLLPACNSLAVNTGTPPRNEPIPALIGISAEDDSSLVGERSCDRISFVQSSSNRSKLLKNSRRSKCKNKMPEMVQKYIDVRNKLAKHRPMNNSKRSLYSKGHSDTEQSPIPTPPATSSITSPLVSSARPHMSSELPTPLRNASPAPTRHSRSSKSNAKSSEEIILPPEPFMDAAADSAAIEPDDAIFKKPLLPPPKVRVSSKSKKKSTEKTAASNQLDASEVPPPRRSKRVHMPVKNSVVQLIFQQLEQYEVRKLTKASRKHSLVRRNEVSSTVKSHLGTGSRSHGRSRKPRQGQSSTTSDLNLSGDTDASCQTTASVNDIRMPAFDEHQRRELSAIFESDTELDEVPTTSTTAKKSSKQPKTRAPLVKRKGQASTQTSNITQSRLEHTHITVPPAPVNELNNIFDQLKHASMQSRATSPSSCIDGTKRTRKVRVRLQRLNLPSSATPEFVTKSNVNDREAQAANTFSAPPSPSVTMAKAGNRVTSAATRTAANSTVDLLSWLKGVCEIQVPSGHEQMFMDMRCSAAGNLMFTVLEGIDYAFYDTDDRASLGYLRFKPRQKKPAKKAKKYHLHFIVLAGEFDIGTDRGHGTFNIGDMVAINRGCRYTIENLRDDVGLLMVIKK